MNHPSIVYKKFAVVAMVVCMLHGVCLQTCLAQSASITVTVALPTGIIDSDNDGFTDLEEFWLGTDPTNSASLFQIASVEVSNGMVRLVWDSSTSTNPSPRFYDVLSANSVTGLLDFATATVAQDVFANMTTNQTEITIPASTNESAIYTVILPDDWFN